MAIQNSLVKKNKDEQVSEFEVGGKTVRLSPAIVKNYLVNGNGNITMQEVVMFIKPNDTDVYCPSCGETLSGGWPLSDADDLRKLCQCPNCGQSIDDTRCEAAEAALDAMGGENNA